MKNIMLLIGNLRNGGAEKSIIKLANELSKQHNVYLVVANKDKADYETSCQVLEVPELRKKSTKLKGIFKVRRLKKGLCIDTAISYTTVFNFINVVSKYKEKRIVSVRNYLSLKETKKLYRILHIIAIKFADKIVCPSNAVKYDQIANYKAKKEKLVVIENFCDPTVIKKLSQEKVDVKNYVLSIARLEKHKGLIELIEAFKIVLKTNSSLKLIILGRGPQKKELQDLINKYRLDKKVILKGFVSNPYKYLKNARCFVLTSYYEGFSNSIIEAMTCACPVVATDSKGGNREALIDNKGLEYGVLVENYEPREIAKAINTAVGNYEYYSKRSYQRAKAFTNKKIMRKWYKII